MTLIIDASVATKWLVVEDGSDRAEALLPRTDLMAPVLIHSEVANGLRRKLRRGELAEPVDLPTLIEGLATIILPIDETPMIGRALRLAGKLDHSVYDCVYLALAEQLDQQLITADHKFLQKVAASELAHLARAL